MQQYSTILMIVAMIALFYFLILRPQKKRQQKVQQTLNSLTPGTDVLLASGVFGRIVEIGEKQAVLEVAPGVEMTVLKQAISRVTTEADLEPEADEDEDDDEELEQGDFTVPDDASSLTASESGTTHAGESAASGASTTTNGLDGTGEPIAGDPGTGEQHLGEHDSDGNTGAQPGPSDQTGFERPTFERPSFERAEFDAASDEGPEGPHDPKKA